MSSETEWPTVRLGDHTTVKARLGWKGLKADEYVEDGYIFLATPNLKGHHIDFHNVDYITKWRYDESPEIQLRVGDVLIVKDGSTLGICNYVRWLPRPTTLNGSIAVVRTRDTLDSEFLFHFVKGDDFQKLITLKKSGLGVPHLFQADLREFPISLPTVPEQRKIARILTTLDNLIEKTEALIAKYQAIKQGMMHDLFTRGVDSSGQLRPTQEQAPDLYKQSELGWIPQDCSVKALKEVAERVVVGLALSTTHAYRERGVALIRNQNIRKGFFEDDDMLFLDPHFASLYPNKAARKGDVLTVRTGSNVGDTALVPDKYVGCPTFTTLITSPDTSVLNPKYLVHYIVSKFGVFELNRLLVGGGKENLNVGEFVKLRVVLPPVESQALFVRALKTMESRLEVERVLLQKYKRQKTGLMQDLLTGKVRVKVDEAEEVATHA